MVEFRIHVATARLIKHGRMVRVDGAGKVGRDSLIIPGNEIYYARPLSYTPLAPQFTGHVLVVTAEHDAFLCGNTSSADCGAGDCSIPAQGRSVFPHDASYDYHIPADTGHEWDKHYSQDESFSAILQWLDQRHE